MQRLIDIMQSLPLLVMALVMAASLGPSLTNTIIAIAIPLVPNVARVIRSNTLSLREMPFVEAARAVGMSELRIAIRHVLPNTLAPLIVLATAQLGSAILVEASLSFLGLGIPEPHPSWGRMLSESAAEYVRTAPWLVIFPGVAISSTVFGTNLLGDALRDILDPGSAAILRAERAMSGCFSRSRTSAPGSTRGRASSRRSTASTSQRRAGRDAGDRRRVGLRQEHDGAVADAPDPRSARPHRRRLGQARRQRSAAARAKTRCARVRGNEISMIFQEPMTSLNPVMTIGKQIGEALILHRDMDRKAALASAPSRCCELVASPSRRSAPRNIRTSSPAACASAP